MCTGILFFLLILAMATYRFGKKRFASLLFVFCVLLIFLIGSGALPGMLLKKLQVYPPLTAAPWANNNAIVVLGGGSLKEGDGVRTAAFAISREFQAWILYRACKEGAGRICHVLVSGGDPLKTGTSEAEVMASTLRAAGVPAADLVIEGKSNNTFQNAQYSSQMLFAGNYDRVVLVTSGLHMKRALLYFAHFMIGAVPAPSDRFAPVYGMIPRSFNFALTDFALHEELGIARLHIYNILGLNTPSEIRR